MPHVLLLCPQGMATYVCQHHSKAAKGLCELSQTVQTGLRGTSAAQCPAADRLRDTDGNQERPGGPLSSLRLYALRPAKGATGATTCMLDRCTKVSRTTLE